MLQSFNSLKFYSILGILQELNGSPKHESSTAALVASVIFIHRTTAVANPARAGGQQYFTVIFAHGTQGRIASEGSA